MPREQGALAAAQWETAETEEATGFEQAPIENIVTSLRLELTPLCQHRLTVTA